jgi:hypothetical protein
MPSAFGVAVRSIRKYNKSCKITPLILPQLEAEGVYTRPTIRKDGLLFDVISDYQMASEFAISRFLTPYLSYYQGWSLFIDSDFILKDNIAKVMEYADPAKAVCVVKHDYTPKEAVKMDGQVQSQYGRKNWSSCMLFNNSNPKNIKLANFVNDGKTTGKELHQFCWLEESDIGAIPEEWNWLEGHSSLDIEPKAVHFTRGIPSMAGYEDVPYADEWLKYEKELPLCKLVS